MSNTETVAYVYVSLFTSFKRHTYVLVIPSSSLSIIVAVLYSPSILSSKTTLLSDAP